MTRAAVPGPEAVRRVRLDPRYRAARAARQARATEGPWRGEGSCLQADPEVFFPATGDDPAPALAICGRCPVRAVCLAAALDCGEGDGVWGATTPEERRVMRVAWSGVPAARRGGAAG